MRRTPLELVERLVVSDRYRQVRGKVRSRPQYPLDADDLEAELNRGILLAARSVKMNVGDPMEYLIAHGYYHVKNVVTKTLNHEIIEECLVCGKSRPYRKNPCATCGCKNFLLHARQIAFLVDDDGVAWSPKGERRRTKSLVEQIQRRGEGECRE